jgi:hypothetical protein
MFADGDTITLTTVGWRLVPPSSVASVVVILVVAVVVVVVAVVVVAVVETVFADPSDPVGIDAQPLVTTRRAARTASMRGLSIFCFPFRTNKYFLAGGCLNRA